MAGRVSAILAPLLLLATYATFLAHRIFFVSSDLGRHLRTGETIVTGFSRAVLTTNFYSSTAPDAAVLNHHWASGVVLHGVWSLVGFVGLHAFAVGLRLVTLLIFYDVARRRAGTGLATLVAAGLVMVLAERTEIRPEIFTELFCAVFVWILDRAPNPSAMRRLWILPVLVIAWVNLHIYFFLGPAILLAYLFAWWRRGDPRARTAGIVLLLTLLAALCNPFGVHGALAPLTIFQNYELTIAENQSPFFLATRMGGTTYVVYLIAAPVLALTFLLAAGKARRQLAWSDVLLGAGILTMGCVAARNLTLFALFALPFLASNLALLLGPVRVRALEFRHRWLGLACLGVLGTVLATQDLRSLGFRNAGERGLGVETGNHAAAEFFRANAVRGPVFNNFDIGGYLIFHLWPQERVFVDNRPEAYPPGFFRDLYWPMLADRDTWARRERQYDFNAIFFTHTDLSPAAQQFLIDRLHDPGWAVVFCDAVNVILVRRHLRNADLIGRYERLAAEAAARSAP